jgi:hypothetical protein
MDMSSAADAGLYFSVLDRCQRQIRQSYRYRYFRTKEYIGNRTRAAAGISAVTSATSTPAHGGDQIRRAL